MSIKSALPVFLALISLSLQPEARADAVTPTTVIKVTTEEIVSVLRNEDISADIKWEQISKIINYNFDFRSMSQSLLDIQWNNASPKEKRLCAEYFAQYLTAIYREQIESFTNQPILYKGEVINGEFAVVDTLIVGDSVDLPVSYKMRSKGGEWTVYDMLVGEVSLMDSHRSVLYNIIQSEGIDGLIRDLQNKVSKYQDSGTEVAESDKK